MQLNYRRQLRGCHQDKLTFDPMNSWRSDFQVVVGIAVKDLACDTDHPASDSTIRGGVELRRGDQEDHPVHSSWTFGGVERALEQEHFQCRGWMLSTRVSIGVKSLHGGRSHTRCP